MGPTYRRHAALLYESTERQISPSKMIIVPSPLAPSAVFYVAYHQVGGIASFTAEIACASPEGKIDIDFLNLPVFRKVSMMYSFEKFLYIWGKSIEDTSYNLYYYNLTQKAGTACEGPQKIIVDPFSGFEVGYDDKMDRNVLGKIVGGSRSEVLFVDLSTAAVDRYFHFSLRPVVSGSGVLAMNNGMTVVAKNDVTMLMQTPYLNSTDNTDVQSAKLLGALGDQVPTTAAISETKDIAAVGYLDGTVRLWDTRYFSRPYYELKSAATLKTTSSGFVKPAPVTVLAFDDVGNDLYVSRKHESPDIPWIESYELSSMKPNEILVPPQIPIAPQITRYLDMNALWPPGESHFTLPDAPVDPWEEGDALLLEERLKVINVEAMLWHNKNLVVGTHGSLMFIDQPPMRPKYSYAICGADGYESVY